ncbi:MAG: HU family DNA-binding protein [Archaeoglobaceae archaeon]
MRKVDLVAEVLERVNGLATRKVVSRVVNEVFEVMAERLASGEEVRVLPFGIFKVVEREARKVRNPRTGEEIMLPRRRVIKFKPGKGLKAELSGSV